MKHGAPRAMTSFVPSSELERPEDIGRDRVAERRFVAPSMGYILRSATSNLAWCGVLPMQAGQSPEAAFTRAGACVGLVAASDQQCERWGQEGHARACRQRKGCRPEKDLLPPPPSLHRSAGSLLARAPSELVLPRAARLWARGARRRGRAASDAADDARRKVVRRGAGCAGEPCRRHEPVWRDAAEPSRGRRLAPKEPRVARAWGPCRRPRLRPTQPLPPPRVPSTPLHRAPWATSPARRRAARPAHQLVGKRHRGAHVSCLLCLCLFLCVCVCVLNCARQGGDRAPRTADSQ